ncbi:MAG: plasmid pRiA4b ORF-3 family protein [Phycisphaerales bacterium]|nr:plasmid pRiA4b ORF-3 family protein [Phycisphaerales bacterium]
MSKSKDGYFPEQLILKVTLMGSNPVIWRRVEVHSGLTLFDLHWVIQCIFDWDDSHLHQFLAPAGGKLTQKAMRDATVYSDIDNVMGMDQSTEGALVGQVLSKDQKQIVYEYDFGDSWEHLVKVEKRIPGGGPDQLPVCLAGENAAPMDDMGGIPGYYRMIEALGDPDDDFHTTAVEWLGEDFDKGRFDLGLANKLLKEAFKPAPNKPRKRK